MLEGVGSRQEHGLKEVGSTQEYMDYRLGVGSKLRYGIREYEVDRNIWINKVGSRQEDMNYKE